MAERVIWQAEGAQKRQAVQRMFAEIAPTYDFLNGLMSLSLHRRWRALAVRLLRLPHGGRALDVCCGTGDFLPHLRRAVGPVGQVVGLDFCLPMLDVAATKGPVGPLLLGDACMLPVQDGCLDAVSVGWGIRNVPDIDAAHREIARVLKNGGRFVSLDMARPCNRMIRAISEFAFNSLVPRLGAIFGKSEAYTYLPKSAQRYWDRERLKASMESAGFVEVEHRDLMFGNICIHSGRKP